MFVSHTPAQLQDMFWCTASFQGFRYPSGEVIIHNLVLNGAVSISRNARWNESFPRWDDSHRVQVVVYVPVRGPSLRIGAMCDEFVPECESMPADVPMQLWEKRDEIDRMLANPSAYEATRMRVMALATLKQLHADGDHAVMVRVMHCLGFG